MPGGRITLVLHATVATLSEPCWHNGVKGLILLHYCSMAGFYYYLSWQICYLIHCSCCGPSIHIFKPTVKYVYTLCVTCEKYDYQRNMTESVMFLFKSPFSTITIVIWTVIFNDFLTVSIYKDVRLALRSPWDNMTVPVCPLSQSIYKTSKDEAVTSCNSDVPSKRDAHWSRDDLVHLTKYNSSSQHPATDKDIRITSNSVSVTAGNLLGESLDCRLIELCKIPS